MVRSWMGPDDGQLSLDSSLDNSISAITIMLTNQIKQNNTAIKWQYGKTNAIHRLLASNKLRLQLRHQIANTNKYGTKRWCSLMSAAWWWQTPDLTWRARAWPGWPVWPWRSDGLMSDWRRSSTGPGYNKFKFAGIGNGQLRQRLRHTAIGKSATAARHTAAIYQLRITAQLQHRKPGRRAAWPDWRPDDDGLTQAYNK